MDTCRDRYGVFNSSLFNVYACAMCYHYLLDSRDAKFIVLQESPHNFKGVMLLTEDLPQTGQAAGTAVFPDLDNPAAMGKVCSTLKSKDCDRWKTCCQSARSCCQTQLDTPLPSTGHVMCPRTWDGFSCVPDTPAGQTAELRCPSYIESGSVSEWASKECTADGGWYTEDGLEWSDYTACVSLQLYRQLFYVAVTCHTLSLILAIPALIILLVLRQLRKQHRIQIHVNLLLSLVLTNIVWVLWEGLVYRDRLDNNTEDTLMHRNTVGCRVLYSLTRYTLSANYFWMFLEGAHLFRLLENAFVVPKNIISYFFFGWLGPLVFVLIYIFFRVYHEHGGCWVQMFAGYEWWVYTPNMVILLCNSLFLVWIVVRLTRQIQVHPNEPSCFRRALKAMAVLTPLFGLQMLVFLYRPSRATNSVYEICAVVCKSSQGTVVALIFCYLNKEVRTQVTLKLRSFKQAGWWSDRWPRTLTTRASRRQSQVGHIHRKSDQSFIDLSVRPSVSHSPGHSALRHQVKRPYCLYTAVRQDSATTLTAVRQDSATTLTAVRQDSGTTLNAVRQDSGTTLNAVRQDSGTTLNAVRQDSDTTLNAVRQDSGTTLNAVRQDSGTTLNAVRQDSDTTLNAVRQDSDTTLNAVRQDSGTTLNAVRQDSDTTFTGVRQDSGTTLTAVQQDLGIILGAVQQDSGINATAVQQDLGIILGAVQQDSGITTNGHSAI